MKYLDEPALVGLCDELNKLTSGDVRLSCRLEAYSLKLAGQDRRVAREVEQQYEDQLSRSGGSYDGLSVSPFGPLSDRNARKTHINLILAMNHTFPDWDFSNVRADEFMKMPAFGVVQNAITTDLLEFVQQSSDGTLLDRLFLSLDQIAPVNESSIYSYTSDVLGEDPFSENGMVPLFNYFLYHKGLKKILFFSCCKRKLSTAMDSDEEDDRGYTPVDMDDL